MIECLCCGFYYESSDSTVVVCPYCGELLYLEEG